MLVELLFVCVFPAGGSALDPAATADPDPDLLAEIRHHSANDGPQWTLRLRRDFPSTVTASLWWIVGTTPSPNAPEVDLMSARVVDLSSSACPALVKIADEVEKLEIPRDLVGIAREDETGVWLELKRPGHESMKMTHLASDDSLVLWSAEVWDDVAACAQARRD